GIKLLSPYFGMIGRLNKDKRFYNSKNIEPAYVEDALMDALAYKVAAKSVQYDVSFAPTQELLETEDVEVEGFKGYTLAHEMVLSAYSSPPSITATFKKTAINNVRSGTLGAANNEVVLEANKSEPYGALASIIKYLVDIHRQHLSL
ncbi:hypothetical protein Ahia01_001290100, partial [Argonauta hians]